MNKLLNELHNRKIEQRAQPQRSLINEDEKMIPFILISNENSGERYDWWEDKIFVEEIDVNGVDYSGLRTLFKDHTPSVDNAIGRVDNVRVEDGALKADVYFGSDQQSYDVFTKYRDGLLTDVSVGYNIDEIVETERKGEPNHVLVTAMRVVELSAVWKGFDSGAVIGRQHEDVEEIEQPKFDAVPLSVLERKLTLQEKTNV